MNSNYKSSVDTEQLLRGESTKRPKIHSDGEKKSASMISQWHEADFDLDDTPEIKQALVRAIDEEFGNFEVAQPGKINSDKLFLHKMNLFYDNYPRGLGGTSAFDYELGYLFVLKGLSEIRDNTSIGGSYVFDVLCKMRPFYNNPDLVNKDRKLEIVQEFPAVADFKESLADILLDIEVFSNLSPGRYYNYTYKDSEGQRRWEDEGYQAWKDSLPSEYRSENSSDMINNNLHWIGLLLLDLYKLKIPESDIKELYKDIRKKARIRLDNIYNGVEPTSSE